MQVYPWQQTKAAEKAPVRAQNFQKVLSVLEILLQILYDIDRIFPLHRMQWICRVCRRFSPKDPETPFCIHFKPLTDKEVQL